jgi:hypothetical protein
MTKWFIFSALLHIQLESIVSRFVSIPNVNPFHVELQSLL